MNTESAQKLKEQVKTAVNIKPENDRFIKGTLIDDYALAWLQRFCTVLLIVAIIGAIWLFAERNLGARTLAPYRIWIPSAYMIAIVCLSNPFLRLGWLGWAFVLVQSINLSGYLFQAIQGLTGVK